MRVGVAGAGVGGLTAALALHARGLRADVWERAPTLQAAGAGVQLGPNAVRVLDRLGLGEAVRAVGWAPEAIALRRASDARLLLRAPLGRAAERRWGAPYLQLHRADLQALLLDAVRARDAAELHLGREVVEATSDGILRLANGRVERCDAVVAADGVRSAARAAVDVGGAPPRFSGQTAWRAVVDARDLPASASQATVWTAPRRHAVHYPLRGGREINLVAVTEAAGWTAESWTERADPAALRSAFADWPEPVASLVAAAAAGPVFRWALYDRPPVRRLARGRAALLGDAGHPVLPFLAQGAAMAIEDAWTLAKTLAGGEGPVETRLARYEALRLPRLRRVQAASSRNARLFHLPDPLAALAFAAAGMGAADGAARRLDWLYGGGPVGAGASSPA